MKTTSFNPRLAIPILGAALFASATVSANDAETSPAAIPAGSAQVDLRVNVGQVGDEVYEARTAIQVPPGHTIGDNVFPYEGIGWENDIVGYRLYLDERAVTDVFGKKISEPVLHTVDYRSKYHDPAEWGLDVMHVGPSMGIGGLGLYRGETLERFGNQGELFAEVVQQSGPEISFKIKHRNVPLADGVTGHVDAVYSMQEGSPLTFVNVVTTLPKGTLATGLAKAGKYPRILSTNKAQKGDWRYIAVWGDERSEAKDGLGTVLFFRAGESKLAPNTDHTYPVQFTGQRFTYAFAGIWEQGPMGISDREALIEWADKQLKLLPR